ncbi:MAG: lycopene cyclase family protein [Myxococcota bacterium]
MSISDRCDVLIVGAGPAGSLLGRALRAHGLATVTVDPGTAWPNTYGLWADEAEQGDIPIRHRWPRTEAVIDGEVFDLGRGYVLVDNERARARLQAGGDLVEGRVDRLEPNETETVVHTTAGPLRARIVVDATGSGRFLERPEAPVLFQTALGQRLRDGAHPFPTDAMRFMDFRSDDKSFLYAMPMSETEVFMEQTRLIDAERSTDTLAPALSKRVDEYRVTGDVAETERVCFPMDAPLPDLNQRVIGFGAAAGFVHPATGYSFGHSVRQAPPVAATIAHHLAADATPAKVARAAYRTMWPGPRTRARALYLYGARLVARFDAATQAQFFRTFFGLPRSRWSAYLAGDTPAGDVAAAMWSVFKGAPWSLRARLSTGA